MAASAMIFTPTSSIVCLPSLSSSKTSKKQASPVSFPDFSSFRISIQLGFTFTQWNGLKKIQNISTSPYLLKFEMKRKRRNKGVYASLFGVGAPEALVIGVVALLVFGPKGLAEVARNLGKTLRAFQPTIRELQDVSREFKSTLEREIGLDDIQTTPSDRYNSTTSKPSIDTSTGDSQLKIDPNGSKAYSSEDYLKITEEQLRAAALVQKHDDETPPDEPRSDNRSIDELPARDTDDTSDREILGGSTMPSGQPESET